MRYQPTGTPEPRDNGENGDARLAEAAESEMVDLGESPLPSRLDVPPASVRSLGRRLDPRLAPVIAVAIVVVALLGTGPLARKPAATPSPSPVAAETSSPEPTDSCPVNAVEPVDPPIMSLGLLNTILTRASAAGVGSSIDAIDVVAPVKGATSVYVGRRMQLKIRDVSCLELVGIDLLDASRPREAALTVRPPSPLEPGATSLIWDGPPAGDWIVRVALQVRTPGGALESVWAVYLFRVNSGFVAWASPVPDGADSGQPLGPLVTPAVPCGPLPVDGTTPPAVRLVAAGESNAGILGDYRWNGVVVSTGVPAPVVTTEPIAVDERFVLLFEENVCATSWRIDVAPGPAVGTVFWGTASVDQSPENPGQRPEVASQNTFMFQQDTYGTYIIQASFDFANGGHEVVYWVVRTALPAVPVAYVAAPASGERIALVRACGVSFQIGERYGSEICADALWPVLPDGPTLSVDAETELRLDADGQLIVGWSVEYVDQAVLAVSGGMPACVVGLTSGYSDVGLSSLEVPALPPGAWSMKVSLTVRTGADTSTVPYYVWVGVPGDPSPAPNPDCLVEIG